MSWKINVSLLREEAAKGPGNIVDPFAPPQVYEQR